MIVVKRALLLMCAALVLLALPEVRAQVAPSAYRSPVHLDAGGLVSAFDPDYVHNKMIGLGGYVDLSLWHGAGIEAEGRWLRFHGYRDITQDHYLIGPRVKVLHLWKAQPYAKALVGFSNMNFGSGIGTGRFTTLAFGGGLDWRIDPRFTLRFIDAEYQYWPSFFDSSLTPYGVSAGVSYHIF